MTTLASTAIIVVNYGSSDLLARNLTRVHAAAPEVSVLVVDNYTSDTERERVRALCAHHGWTLVESPTNLGFGGGANLGIRTATEAARFLLLNPDAHLDGPSLRRLIEVVADDPMILAAPVITATDGRVWFDGSDLHLTSGRMRATRKRETGSTAPVTEWLTGACLMISREMWDRVGGFDERYFLYWEDVDLSWRCREAGASLVVVRDATAVHDEGGTSQPSGGERARSSLYYYYNIRNRLLFAALHLDRATQRRWILGCGAEAWDILLRGGRRQLVHSSQPWRAAFTGTRDGLAMLRRLRAARGSAPLRVLESFPEPRPTTNPYIVMLKECLDAHPDLSVDTFTWRRAFTRRYDVFHAHWPEILVSGSSPVRKAVRQVLFAGFVLRLRLSRTAIVRTRHNLELPQGITRGEITLLRWFERSTTFSIRLNPHTNVPGPHSTILHGHYRNWFARFPRAPETPGRLGYVGLIRRYKAVDTLIDTFRQTRTEWPDISLFVSGKPTSTQLAEEITALAGGDDRVSLHLAFLSEPALVAAITAAEIVILPYREMHNSGGVLTALSLDRPVLVPDNDVNRALAAEVGAEWVQLYSDPLSPSDLTGALGTLRHCTSGVPEGPDLSARSWETTAEAHVKSFREALVLKRTRATQADY